MREVEVEVKTETEIEQMISEALSEPVVTVPCPRRAKVTWKTPLAVSH